MDKKQKKIGLINDCGCVIDYVELEKAMLFRCNKPTARLDDPTAKLNESDNLELLGGRK